MGPVPSNRKWARWLVPNALFVGVAAGFATCCIAGVVASHQNPLRKVERFHLFICPETLYYPTVNQLCELAQGRLTTGKIAVIIGGNSRMHGTCQPLARVWTRQLQALLGDQFEVLNFGFRGAYSAEIGAIAAETLSRRYPKVIFVTDCAPGDVESHPDGVRFRYFFWDAYFKHLLYPDAERELRLREESREVPVEEQRQGRSSLFEGYYEDVKQRMRLDSVCYFTDLWNTIGYRRFFTVWTGTTADRPVWPRRKYHDPDSGPRPLSMRYPEDREELLARVRPPRLCLKDERGCWVKNPPVSQTYERALRTCFAASMRPRTVMVVLRQSSYLSQQLSREDQEFLGEVCRLTVRMCEEAGMTALEAGADYAFDDYADILHLTGSGGAKLAADVAPKVKELARRLGYMERESP